MREWRPWIATKREVLKFIAERRIITWRDLVNYFGYKPSSAKYWLWRLQKEGLISKLVAVHGKWVLTEKGFERLDYYGEKID